MRNMWIDIARLIDADVDYPMRVHVDMPLILYDLYRRYSQKAVAMYAGRNRNVFHMPGNYVVKLPACEDGCADNDWEGSVSNGTNYGDPSCVQYARTRLIYVQKIPVVLMELTVPVNKDWMVSNYGKVPDWVYSVDCAQVGVTRKGRLVAYDYGIK